MASVEIVYAKEASPAVSLQVAWKDKMTIQDALDESGILEKYPEVANLTVGIFARIVSLDTVVKPNDRIEIYRALLKDPKETRRARAKK